MDDEMDAFFNSGAPGVPQAGKGGQQSTSSDMSEMDNFFNPKPETPALTAPQIGAQPQAIPTAPTPPTPISPPVDEMGQFLNGQVPEETQAPIPQTVDNRPGYQQAIAGAVARGVGNFKQAVPTFQGMLAEYQGDEEGKQAAANEIQQIEAGLPAPVVPSISDIHNLDDFGYWAVEKFGEQLPVILSMGLTGGAGALAGNLVGRGMLMKQAARAAMMRKGATAGVFAGSAGIETPGTAIEQLQSTGNFNPELSLGTGLVKGALESYTPFKFLKEFPTTGVIKGAVKSLGREAITEGLQEQADILARKYSDPNYSYFSEGMVMRTLDAAAAGAVVGGGTTLALGGAGKALGLKKPEGDPGEEVPIKPEDLTNYPPAPGEEDEGVRTSGPISWLRDQFMRGNPGSDESIPLNPKGVEDVIEQGPILSGIKRIWQRAGSKQDRSIDDQNLFDDNVPRYAIIDPNSNSGNKIYSDIGLEDALAKRPNENFQPRIVKVDMDSLQPAAITAELFDLPASDSSRVAMPAVKRMFFLPGVTPAEKAELTTRYDFLVEQLQAKPWQLETQTEAHTRMIAGLQAEYEALLNKGLRVIPSPGSSFHYNGLVDGRSLDKDGKSINAVPRSSRSTSVGWLDQYGFTSFGRPQGAAHSSTPVVAVDLNKLPLDAVLDSKGNPFLSREGLKEHLLDMGGFKIKEGVKLPQGVIVPGIGSPIGSDRKLPLSGNGAEIKARTKGRINFWGNPYTDYAREVGDEVKGYLTELQPVLDKIYKRMGLKNPPDIYIDLQSQNSSYVNIPNNEIFINIPKMIDDNWYYTNTTDAKRMDVLFTVLHELGHAVTLRSWSHLPSALHEQADIGYQRDLLRWRTQGMSEHLGYPIGTMTSTDRQIDYNLTFVEYLAEQFRRWALSDARILTDLDKFYKNTGKELERLKKEAAEQLGLERATNLYKANFSFNQVMEYLEASVEGGLSPVQMAQSTFDESYPTPIELASVMQQIDGEIARFRHLMTQDMSLLLSPEIENMKEGGKTSYKFGQMNPKTRNIKILVGSLAVAGDRVKRTGQGIFVHEVFHGVENELTVGEAAILYETAKREKVMSPQDIAGYVRSMNKWMDENGILDPVIRKEQTDHMLQSEHMAKLIELRIEGRQFDNIISKVLDRIIETIQRLVNIVRHEHYKSSEDIVRAFYRGEMTRRYDERAASQATIKRLEEAGAFAKPAMSDLSLDPNVERETFMAAPDQGIDPERVFLPSGESITLVESKDPQGKIKIGTYVLKGELDQTKGFVSVSHDAVTDSYLVEQIFVEPAFTKEWVGPKLYRFIQSRVGQQVKPNGILEKAGYQSIVGLNPALVKDYVFDKDLDVWISPYQLQKRINLTAAMITNGKRQGLDVTSLREVMAHLKDLRQAWNVNSTSTEVVGREIELKNTEANGDRSDAQLVKAVTGENIGDSSDPFADIQDQVRDEETRKAALFLGIDPEMAAPSQADQYLSNQILKNSIIKGGANILTGGRAYDEDSYNGGLSGIPTNGATLNGIRYEKDRISWFSKIFFGLHQLAWRNTHLFQLRTYLALCEQMNATIMGWISKADHVAKSWDKLPEAQRNALSEYMFWLTEMDYLTRAERAANVVRHPTQAERNAYLTLHRISAQTEQVGLNVEKQFADYLAEVERITIKNATRNIQNPVGLAAELAAIAQDMANLRSKPYFPMTRFGEFTITVRNPADGKVEAFFAYSTPRERRAAVNQVALNWPGMDLSAGRVPEEAQEFMGLPGPLLRLIKANMAPQLSAAQRDWLDKFTTMMAPEKSFRKRWLARKGTSGYSLDGIRVFSQYFRSGARYLGRIEFRDDMQDQVTGMQATIKGLAHGDRRQMIVDYMQKHLNYIMEGGRDWGKMKSIISIFQLGGSVAAAGMNLTQVPLASYPYLAGLFGDAQTLKSLTQNADVLRPTFGQPARGTQDYLAARDEAVAQGKIEAGQAIDLGAFAEYDNLNRSYAGTAAQRAWRKIGYVSMIMFSKSEQFNREWCFKSAYELALNNKSSSHFQDMARSYPTEILEIAARRNITTDQATAFMVARRCIDQTQLVFQPYARPPFLRSGFGSTLQIFFSYTQGMLYLLGNSPGQKRMWFGLLAMYGLAGLPGSEDLDRLIRLLARKFMGKDFSPQLEARKMIVEQTRGTMFDQVGPDLALHGISHYSMFGIGMLPEGWGIPRFDASASGSMGQIVPGMSELLRGAANGSNWKDITADVARDVAGAGFGQMFALMQFANSAPMSSDLKKWEKVFPRSVKAMSKAYRYATQGEEVTNQGGTLAEFDMRDPDDVATVIAQALGFTPEKITKKWEHLRATQDVALWYESRKLTLYTQLDVAIQNGESEDQKTAIQGMVAFNKELTQKGYGSMGIQVAPVVASMKNRARTRALQSNDLPTKINQIPLSKDMMKLYPGMERKVIEQKTVK